MVLEPLPTTALQLGAVPPTVLLLEAQPSAAREAAAGAGSNEAAGGGSGEQPLMCAAGVILSAGGDGAEQPGGSEGAGNASQGADPGSSSAQAAGADQPVQGAGWGARPVVAGSRDAEGKLPEFLAGFGVACGVPAEPYDGQPDSRCALGHLHSHSSVKATGGLVTIEEVSSGDDFAYSMPCCLPASAQPDLLS